MTSFCANHPDKPGANFCDVCDRYLCNECLGPPVQTSVRLSFYCETENCKQKYLVKTRWMLLIFLVAPVTLLLVYFIIGLATKSWSGLFFVFGLISSLAHGINLFKEYRRRKKLWDSPKRLPS